MKSRYAAAAAAFLCAATIAAVVVHGRGGGEVCYPPVTTVMTSDSDGAQRVVDVFVGTQAAAGFKQPSTVGWGIVTVFRFTGGTIDVLVIVGDGYAPGYGLFLGERTETYRVKLTRECQGGDWKLVSAVKVA